MLTGLIRFGWKLIRIRVTWFGLIRWFGFGFADSHWFGCKTWFAYLIRIRWFAYLQKRFTWFGFGIRMLYRNGLPDSDSDSHALQKQFTWFGFGIRMFYRNSFPDSIAVSQALQNRKRAFTYETSNPGTCVFLKFAQCCFLKIVKVNTIAFRVTLPCRRNLVNRT